MRPANDAQSLSYRLLHEGEDRMSPDVQQSFIDQRGAIPGEVEEEEEDMQYEPASPLEEPVAEKDGSDEEDP
eukprot:2894251-Karenia_brevis.AAC.1